MHPSAFTRFITKISNRPVRLYGLLVSVTLLIFLGVSSCDFQANSSHPIESWPMLKDCSLHHKACQIQKGDQSVLLKITPNPIKVARMLTVEVVLEGIEAEKVELDIAGENMYMGYNRVNLTPVPNQPGHYQGQSMLAFCTLDDMEWQVSVLITQADRSYLAVPFALKTPYR